MFYIGTSWKMNKTRDEAVQWIEAVRADSPPPASVCRFVMPAFTALDAVYRALDGSDILLGAQNVHEAHAGAHTGEVSAPMLVDAGCTLVEIGHSERRQAFGERDETINAKVVTILEHGLRPLVCVGDSPAERACGVHLEAVGRQAGIALAGLDAEALALCLLAYEPVWAIGDGGTPASLAQVEEMHAMLKRRFATTPVLYGGSVSAANAGELAGSRLVDGLFVGRAALVAGGFNALVARAVEAFETR